jgi:hypothetical protein
VRHIHIRYIDAPQPELYDTRIDPHELKNLSKGSQALAHEGPDQLYAVVRRFTPTGGNAEAAKKLTDPAMLDRLRVAGTRSHEFLRRIQPGRALPEEEPCARIGLDRSSPIQ